MSIYKWCHSWAFRIGNGPKEKKEGLQSERGIRKQREHDTMHYTRLRWVYKVYRVGMGWSSGGQVKPIYKNPWFFAHLEFLCSLDACVFWMRVEERARPNSPTLPPFFLSFSFLLYMILRSFSLHLCVCLLFRFGCSYLSFPPLPVLFLFRGTGSKKEV